MKQLVTILLSVSLFVPHIAKMMAYVDCTFVTITYNDPTLCDCNLIIDHDLLPGAPDLPDRQKELSLKADWKYTCEHAFRLAPVIIAAGSYISTDRAHSLAEGFAGDAYHPPRC